MFKYDENPNKRSKCIFFIFILSVMANIAGVLEFAGIRASEPKCDPIVKTVVIHDTDTVTVPKYVYSVEYDTIRVRSCKGKDVVTVDEYIDLNQKLPTPYRSSDVFVGFKSSNQFWGRKFAPITEYSLGCNGKIKRDIPTHPGWIWCTGTWIMLFKEPIPLWEIHNE